VNDTRIARKLTAVFEQDWAASGGEKTAAA
jgi:hypothetical protein